jgi:hypothetical protein
MKTSLSLLASTLLLPLAGCESTTPAQLYAQTQQLVAQAYGNKLSPAQQAALATAIYRQAEATRAIQQAQQAAIISQGFQNAGNIIANSTTQPNFTPIQPVAYPSLKGTVLDPIYTQPANPTTHYIGDSSSIPVGH